MSANQLSVELQSANGNFVIAKDGVGYLGVNAGEGLDPADPQFTNKVFANSLLKQGGTLALEDLKLRELALPLTLQAASKDALNALVRQINVIVNTTGCELAWSDEGTTVVTYFDLASGQLDAEFDFRQGQQAQPMLKAKLRLFVQPLGRSSQNSGALAKAGGGGAEVSGTPPVLVYHAASSLAGDAQALLSVNEVEGPGPAKAFLSALSVLPNASYVPWIPAASLTTAWKATTANGYSFLSGGASTVTVTREPTTYFGNHRILALARLYNNASPARIAVEPSFTPFEGGASGVLGATVSPASESRWFAVDCGVVSRSSLAAINNQWSMSLSTTATIALYGFVMLPEDSTTWYNAPAEENSGRVEWGGVSGHVIRAGGIDVSGEVRGAIPTMAPGASPPTLAFLTHPLVNGPPTVRKVEGIQVQARTRYVF